MLLAVSRSFDRLVTKFNNDEMYTFIFEAFIFIGICSEVENVSLVYSTLEYRIMVAPPLFILREKLAKNGPNLAILCNKVKNL